jgi:hypothetical protein
MDLIKKYIALSRHLPEHTFSMTDIADINERGINVPSIIQARIEYMTMDLKLKNWVPSSPTSPPKYNINITTQHGAITGLGSLELYPLSWLFTYLSNDREVRWVSSTHVMLGDISVHSEHLEDIAEYTLKGDEKLWHPQEPYASQWARIASGQAITVKREPKKEREPKVERPSKEKPTGDVITLADLCSELGIDGSKARQKLRAKNIAKPYAWNKDEAEAIKKILK